MNGLATHLFCVFVYFLPTFTCGVVSVAHDADKTKRPQKHPVAVKDSIESNMTMLDDYRYPTGVFNPGLLAQFSPDGKKFLILVRKGNLQQNTNEYSMLLFRTEELRGSPKPEVLLTVSSSSNREAIKDLVWLDDNETVGLLGEHPGEQRQLYTFNTRTRTLKKRTEATTDIDSFSMTPKGDQFAYVAEQPVTTIFDEKTQRSGRIVSKGDWIGDIVDLGQSSFTQRGGWYGNARLFFVSRRGVSRSMEIRDRISEWNTVKPFLSPDGEHVLMALQAGDVPAIWKDYLDADVHEEAEKKMAAHGYGHYSFLRRYVLIDTQTGKSRVLLNAPIGPGAPQVAWAPDGHSVVVSNVYLPLDDTDGDEREARQSKTFAVEVVVPTGTFIKVTQEKLKVLSWDARTNRLLFEPSTEDAALRHRPKLFFEKRGETWERVGDVAKGDDRPDIVQEEDLNTPPRIFAVDGSTHERFLLLDLNPQFTDLEFGRVEEIRWKATDGHSVKGGLYYPVDYLAGKRYPLVIQTHGWESDKFMIDGSYPTGFAAQELAGKGIMVVQADEGVENGYLNTEKEAPGETSAFEGLIDDLSEKGMIDREHVGIIGFSRTGFHVKYALTHSRYHFAAASIIDAFDGGYVQYLLKGATPGSDWENVNGGPPFGEGLKLWLERAPDLNVQRIRTPLRIVSENPDVALADYFWYAASNRLGIPIEMVVLQSGEHYLRKPWNRMVASQGNVDWFCFWLKSEQDSDPAKSEQYIRWREMRISAKQLDVSIFR